MYLLNEFYFHRDEEYKFLCNVIHILPGNILFHYYFKQMKLKIDTSFRLYNIYFYNNDVLSIWESTLSDIFNFSINESIEDDFDWFVNEVNLIFFNHFTFIQIKD